MVSNVAPDIAVGSVPVLRSVFDLFDKAHNRHRPACAAMGSTSGTPRSTASATTA